MAVVVNVVSCHSALVGSVNLRSLVVEVARIKQIYCDDDDDDAATHLTRAKQDAHSTRSIETKNQRYVPRRT